MANVNESSGHIDAISPRSHKAVDKVAKVVWVVGSFAILSTFSLVFVNLLMRGV